jgi:hypothetical protein
MSRANNFIERPRGGSLVASAASPQLKDHAAARQEINCQ